MKNLLIYVNPAKTFIDDYENLVKCQIDNSLFFGWKEEDIILAMNFDYEYRGVKSLLVGDSCYYAKRRRASKQIVICQLFDQGLVEDDCWYHDSDAFQLRPFEKGEPDLRGRDIGFVTNISSPYLIDWNGGSFFFKPSSRDVFEMVKEDMYRRKIHDEQSICAMASKNYKNINSRYTILNCTYNYTRVRDTIDHYDIADKPIIVLHFNPNERETFNKLKPLIPAHLLEIFKNHGYEEN